MCLASNINHISSTQSNISQEIRRRRRRRSGRVCEEISTRQRNVEVEPISTIWVVDFIWSSSSRSFKNNRRQRRRSFWVLFVIPAVVKEGLRIKIVLSSHLVGMLMFKRRAPTFPFDIHWSRAPRRRRIRRRTRWEGVGGRGWGGKRTESVLESMKRRRGNLICWPGPPEMSIGGQMMVGRGWGWHWQR